MERWLRRAFEMMVFSDNAKYITAAAILMFLAFALGAVMPMGEGSMADNPLFEGLESIVSYYQPYNPFSVIFLFLKNSLTALIAFALSPLLLVTPVLVLSLNGFLLGIVGNVMASQVSLNAALAALVPHGIFEIPALVLASAAGLRLGWAALRKLKAKLAHAQFSIAPDFAKSFRLFIVAIVLLLIAAVVETYVTPYVLELVMGSL
jgi:stage II sporulation protein M